LTNPRLFELLLERKRAGVSVEIILADDRMNFSNPNVSFQTLIEADGIVRVSRFPRLMHHKFCIIDQRLLFTGSYNWTKNAESHNLENVILTTDKNLIHQFLAAFEDLQKITEKVTQVNSIDLHDYVSIEEKNRETGSILTTEPADQTHPTEPTPIEFSPSEITEEVLDLLEKAELAYLTGKHTAAMEICERILHINPTIAQTWIIMASVKWRQNKFSEQVQFAEKAKDLAPDNMEAYNLLGIGYAHQKKESQSIKHYEICLKNNPDDYVVLRNRALSYIQIELSNTTPANLRKQYKEKADRDLNTVIALTNQYESEHQSNYLLYYIRGIAKYELNKLIQAKPDLDKALQLYESTAIQHRDIHEQREIKSALKDIANYLKKGE
jgi:tetratricopeptide (TPR) repeat protein